MISSLYTSRRSRGRVLADMDWVLITSAFVLSVLGAFLVWSATRQSFIEQGLNSATYFWKQALNIIIGVSLGFVLSRFDHRMLRAYTPVIYGFSILGLVIVLSPLGTTVNGAQNWISLGGGFSVQPSEFTKVALVTALAFLLADKGHSGDTESQPTDREIVTALAIVAFPALLILLEPDLGTVIVICVSAVSVVAISGAPRRWVLGILGAIVAACVLAVSPLSPLKDYQLARITCFVNPQAGVRDICFQQIQSRIAVGAGGIGGQGLFHGQQTQGRFVSYNYTDSIISVAGEELGLVGSLLIVALLSVIVWRGVVIAFQATDLFGRLVAVGVVCWFAFQAFENIGMNLGIMPITGVPLPFMSYGGSSMFACWLGIGLLVNIHMATRASVLRA
ncbi:MAG: rod shape-determining protein RodA [Actinobacteria bacterium]|nr:rod shape-determining protein RodA [Actinomycetota bacterium]